MNYNYLIKYSLNVNIYICNIHAGNTGFKIYIYLKFKNFVSICSDLGKVSTAGLLLAVEMMRFLCWMVDHSPTVLGNTYWDLLLCSMLAWLEVRFLSPSSFTLFVCSRQTHSDTFPVLSRNFHSSAQSNLHFE